MVTFLIRKMFSLYMYSFLKKSYELDCHEFYIVGNEAKGRISERVLQENRSAYQRVINVRFSENLACFFFLQLTPPYALLSTIFCLNFKRSWEKILKLTGGEPIFRQALLLDVTFTAFAFLEVLRDFQSNCSAEHLCRATFLSSKVIGITFKEKTVSRKRTKLKITMECLKFIVYRANNSGLTILLECHGGSLSSFNAVFACKIISMKISLFDIIRFSCRTRKYRYFFPADQLNIEVRFLVVFYVEIEHIVT